MAWEAPDPERVEADSLASAAVALPAMLVLGWLLALLHAWFVVGYLFHATYHELGHTVAAWLSGRTAFAIPVLVTFISAERSTGLSVVILVALVAGAVAAGRGRRFALALVLGSLAALSLYLSFVAPESDSRMWVTFAGCGGELVLSALVAASFYAHPPERLRWDFWRWPFVLVACCVFVNASRAWGDVAADPDRLPRGTAMEGSRDANGDMDKLLRAGWTPEGIARAYVGIADAAWLGLGVLYAVGLARAIRRAR